MENLIFTTPITGDNIFNKDAFIPLLAAIN